MKEGGSILFVLLLFCTVTFPAESSQLQCEWSGGSGKLQGYIAGPPTTVSAGNEPGGCRDICVSQSTFTCAAVNYRSSDGSCELVAENDQTASVVEPVDSIWQYFIRPICAGTWLPWTTEKGKFIGDDSSHTPLSSVNLPECMTHCLRDSTVECRAINTKVSTAVPQHNNCNRYSQGINGALVSDSDTWQYFNKPLWYSESSSDGTKVTAQGSIGFYQHIFTDKKVSVDGYLVAWQYYMQPNIFCTTYAAIWRKMGNLTYRLISRTLLAPEQPSEAGVRFQFVQDEVIRVKEGDVLAVNTKEGNAENGCKTTLVSVNTIQGKNMTITAPKFGRVQINTTLKFPSSALRIATPALKAYISAYLFLKNPPMTYHNTSLSHGQIWLELPPPLTTEESVVVAGYGIICSTDVNLSQLVPCYDSLVPVSSKDVLLNLPDVTRAYHVSVQIARNFNGVELLEDKYSPVSDAVCADQEQSDQVNIHKLYQTNEEGQPELLVTFFHSFQEVDTCAKAIKLNYSGYDSEYRTIDDSLQREFVLQLEQGTTYQLTIYLKLADGAEIVFWSQEYTTAAGSTTAKTEEAEGGLNGKSVIVLAAAIAVPLVVLTALSIVIFFLYRRGAFTRCMDTPGAAKSFGGLETSADKVQSIDEYEEVSSPPVHVSNEYEEKDVTTVAGSNDYQTVGASSVHIYEKLNIK